MYPPIGAGMRDTLFRKPKTVNAAWLNFASAIPGRSQESQSYSGFEKMFYLWPVDLDDAFGFEMSAAGKKPQLDTRRGCKSADRSPGNIRVIFGVEHHDLRGCQFLHMMRRVEESAGVQLVPVPLRETVAVTESLADVSSITFVGSLRFSALSPRCSNSPPDNWRRPSSPGDRGRQE